MALDRTWYNGLVDDPGDNLSGTRWDKAAVDSLMDAIDASLAAGGTVAALTVTPALGTNGAFAAFVNTGGTNYVGTDNAAGSIFGGAAYALALHGGLSAGVRIVAAHASGRIIFASGGTTQVGQWTSAGELLVGTLTSTISAARQVINFTGGTNNGLVVNDTASGSGCGFIYFTLAGTLIGSITRNAATSAVLYNISSDQRLKTDRGLASDLAALRGVMVHDFDWTADGTPDRGVFAQEAITVFPRAITKGVDEGLLKMPWMADYSKFVPDLIVGWQQHDARIAALEARVK